ncbi:CRISPR-associated endonuclease Cas2, partial [Neisseria sp. P0015.S004]
MRFYNLGSTGRRKVEHPGAKPTVDVFKDTLIV